MKKVLSDLFDQVNKNLSTSIVSKEGFIFSAETLPIPSIDLETDQLAIKKGQHSYEVTIQKNLSVVGFSYELHFQAHKPILRNLALLILAELFHPEIDHIHINLLHTSSEIKHLIIQHNHLNENSIMTYIKKPFAFGYHPRKTQAYAGSIQNRPVTELPCLYLAVRNPTSFSENEDLKLSDTVVGFGGDIGSVWLAELLLNASLVDNEVSDYKFEGEMGWPRGVGPGSAELQIHLPGSVMWDDVF